MQQSKKLLADVDLFLWLFFSIWLIVDTFTGFTANVGVKLPLSQFFKLFVFFLIIYKLGQKKEYLIVVLFTFAYFAVLLITHGIRNSSYFVTITHLTKFISTIYIYLYLVYTIKLMQDHILYKIKKIFYLGFIIIAANILLGLFHIGNRTYVNEGIGYKGFFYAGNELGGVFGCIIPFILYIAYWKLAKTKYIILSGFILLISIILSTKSVILISLISILLIPWIYGGKSIRKKMMIFGMIFIIPSVYLLINQLIKNNGALVVKYSYVYNRSGIIGLILSDRDEFWRTRSTDFFSSSFFDQFWGLGESITVEMDPFDVLLNYGYFGLIAIIVVYLFIIVTAYRSKNNNSYVPLLIYQDWLLITMSILSGHIVFSSMAGLYIALINSLAFIKKNKKLCLI